MGGLNASQGFRLFRPGTKALRAVLRALWTWDGLSVLGDTQVPGAFLTPPCPACLIASHPDPLLAAHQHAIVLRLPFRSPMRTFVAPSPDPQRIWPPCAEVLGFLRLPKRLAHTVSPRGLSFLEDSRTHVEGGYPCCHLWGSLSTSLCPDILVKPII